MGYATRESLGGKAGDSGSVGVLGAAGSSPIFANVRLNGRVLQPLVPLPPPLPAPPQHAASFFEVLGYLWKLAAGDAAFPWRFTLAAVLLLAAKVAGVAVSFFFKTAVDKIAEAVNARASGLLLVASLAAAAAMQAVLFSGVAHVIKSVATEARVLTFAPIAQAAGRRISLHLMDHVLSLDAAFHLSQRTGALQHAIDRGSKSVGMVYRALVFTFVPTFLELVLVSALMWRSVSPVAAMWVAVTFVAYVWWTAAITGWLKNVRHEMNDAMEAASGKAMDALLNVDTVKLFDNRVLECVTYDEKLVDYQNRALVSEVRGRPSLLR